MRLTKIYNLDQWPTNDRNGSYGGAAGSKEGITINGRNWIVKYPKTTKGMSPNGDKGLLSYTTAPLSEYIGSHIYQILGIEVHETVLGIRNGRLVVACQDFCQQPGDLKEIRTLKNVFNEKLNDMLETSISSTGSDHNVDMDEMMIHLEYNPMLQKIPGVKKRFWEQFVIDILINNNDRNNGNWGILTKDGCFVLAPVFDNGAAFSNKYDDERLAHIMNSPGQMKNSVLNTTTVYSRYGKQIHARDILTMSDPGLDTVLQTLVPKIREQMPEIAAFVNAIPEETEGGISVCSQIRKQFYLESMNLRLENFLVPAYERALELKN